MAHCLRAMLRAVGVVVAVSLPITPALSQEPQPAKKHAEAVQRIQKMLDERVITASEFQTATPLGKLLATIEPALAKKGKIGLRIDAAAFGELAAQVETLPLALPATPNKTSVRRVLELAIGKSKIKVDYMIGDSEVVITTPERALDTVIHDIRDLAERPGAARIVETIFSTLDPMGQWPANGDREAVRIVNGTRLVIHANAARHAQIDELLQVFRRIADLAVIVNSRLYEVDETYYQKLKNVKHVDLEEEELRFLEGVPLDDTLYKLLAKQKMIVAGDEFKVADGGHGTLLSRHSAFTCLPSPEQVRKGDRNRQTVVAGAAFVAAVHVTPDRRYVRVKFMEKSTDVEQILKVKAWGPVVLGPQDRAPDFKPWDAEIAFMRESVVTRMLDIPDGGTILVPVEYRPASAAKNQRRWVLAITPRIYIEEEERQIREGALQPIP